MLDFKNFGKNRNKIDFLYLIEKLNFKLTSTSSGSK